MWEICAGSGVMAQAFRERGWTVVTVDLYKEADWQVDVNTITKEQMLERSGGIAPSVIWFGPSCTAFSVASIGHHWTGGHRAYIPKTKAALDGIQLVKKCDEIRSWFPNAVYGIENPRGVLRKLGLLDHLTRRTITFCQFGDNRMKPTDIWTNADFWKTPPTCKNGDPCHVRAPRGARTGTQGLKGAYERGIYPKAFCESFADAITKNSI